MKEGLVYVFTGDGKGKTSAALGTVLRAVGNGMKVVWVAWYKQSSWHISEVISLKKLDVPVYLMGVGFHLNPQKSPHISLKKSSIKLAPVGTDGLVVDTASEKQHLKAAKEALSLAKKHNGVVDLLVLDEVINAANDGLVGIDDVLQLISERGTTNLILTGRGVDERIMQKADLVSDIKNIKHPYDSGQLAVKGLDF